MEDHTSSPEDLEPDFTTKESGNSNSDIDLSSDDDHDRSTEIETLGTRLIVSNSRASISLSQAV